MDLFITEIFLSSSHLGRQLLSASHARRIRRIRNMLTLDDLRGLRTWLQLLRAFFEWAIVAYDWTGLSQMVVWVHAEDIAHALSRAVTHGFCLDTIELVREWYRPEHSHHMMTYGFLPLPDVMPSYDNFLREVFTRVLVAPQVRPSYCFQVLWAMARHGTMDPPMEFYRPPLIVSVRFYACLYLRWVRQREQRKLVEEDMLFGPAA